MKARTIAGLLASLLVLVAASSADAAPKRKGSKHATRPAAATAGDTGATTTASETATEGKGKARKKKGSRRHKAATKQASASAAAAHQGGTTQAVMVTPESREAEREKSSLKEEPRPARTAVPGLSRFVASGVPLVEVREGRLKAVGSARQPCGPKAPWAKTKGRWKALDAWGQVTGTRTVGGSERYDGTGCHQIWFSEGTGRGLFVAEGSGYTAGASAEWKADAEQKRRFDHLYAAQEVAWVEGKLEPAAQGRRTLFFQLPAQEAAREGAPTQRRPVRWAVSGGRVLVVGYMSATGAWKVGHVLPPNGKVNAYEPLAVLDVNGDGLPEIVVHEEAGGVFTDRVLSFDPAAMRWETAIESPGGASK